jgi:hypothetical protein
MGHALKGFAPLALVYTSFVLLTSVTDRVTAQAPAVAKPRPMTRIVNPERGVLVSGNRVRVVLAAEGICALSGGETEYTFHDVRPGNHRVIALLADYRHRPIKTAAADTVLFTVK